jgi:hypothetical protein
VEDLKFSDIFGESDYAKFLSAFCERHLQHFGDAPPGRFENLFSWDLINDLLSQNLLDEKRLRVVKDSRDLPQVLYRRDNERKSIDARKLTDLLNQGASLAFNGAQHFSPGVRRIALELERRLDQKLNVNAYVSFGTGGAFTSHYDTHDVLVLQVFGEKLWTLFGEPEAHPIIEHKVQKRHSGRGRPVAMEINMRAGEILFIPRGFYHQAAVRDATSVHLTFGIHTARGVDFVDEVRKRCAEIEEFRKDLLTVAGPEALAERERVVKDLLHKLVDEMSFEAFLDQCKRGRDPVDQFRLGPAKPLPTDPVLAPMVRQRDGFPLPAKTDDGLAEKVIDRLVDRDRMKLSELCDSFDGEIGSELVRSTVGRLVDQGLVELV